MARVRQTARKRARAAAVNAGAEAESETESESEAPSPAALGAPDAEPAAQLWSFSTVDNNLGEDSECEPEEYDKKILQSSLGRSASNPIKRGPYMKSPINLRNCAPGWSVNTSLAF